MAVMNDDDLDSSRKPLMSSDSAENGRELGTFQTPADGKRNPGEGERHDHDHDLGAMTKDPEPVANGATEQSATDGVTGKRLEGIWKRRSQQGQHEGMPMVESQEKVSANHGVDREFERALGEEMLQHFQGEAARLQTQNEVLLQEIKKLREEKQHALLSMPSSWKESRRSSTPPPTRNPPTQESQPVWMSPESALLPMALEFRKGLRHLIRLHFQLGQWICELMKLALNHRGRCGESWEMCHSDPVERQSHLNRLEPFG